MKTILLVIGTAIVIKVWWEIMMVIIEINDQKREDERL
jgi:hypothetical protein